jgi:hypothetical protein
MPTDSRIYIESCPFIDMAKHHARLPLSTLANQDARQREQQARERNVWFVTKLLEAARAGKVLIFTSMITMAECTHVGDAAPSDDTKRFYMGLLNSGRSGVQLVQPTLTIIEASRALRWDSGIALGGIDSIHLASARQMKCEELITTDGKLLKNGPKILELQIRAIQASDTRCLPGEYNQFPLPGAQA